MGCWDGRAPPTLGWMLMRVRVCVCVCVCVCVYLDIKLSRLPRLRWNEVVVDDRRRTFHRPARNASGSTKRKVSLWCSVVTRRSVPRVGSFGEFLELGGELKAVLVLHLLV